jgi:hypothetical protein
MRVLRSLLKEALGESLYCTDPFLRQLWAKSLSSIYVFLPVSWAIIQSWRGNDGPGSKGQAELITPCISLHPLSMIVRVHGPPLSDRSHGCHREPLVMTAINSILLRSKRTFQFGDHRLHRGAISSIMACYRGVIDALLSTVEK